MSVVAILIVFPGLPLQDEHFSSIPLFFHDAPVGRNAVGCTDRRTLVFPEHMDMKHKCIINLAVAYQTGGFFPILATTQVNVSFSYHSNNPFDVTFIL
jgi:hypothetical protein